MKKLLSLFLILTMLVSICTDNVFTISAATNKKQVICIDAGHQTWANLEKEPIGPGAKATKFKVTGGTSGLWTKQTEYALALKVAKKLRKILKKRGYKVIMCRTTNDVNMSNSERAAIANNNNADAFIRIHANGAANKSVNGAMTICQTKNNPFNSNIYTKSKLFSEKVLDGVVNKTGCKKLYVWETDTMSGINWSKVPVTIIEMGYMTNETEDRALNTSAYQKKMAEGMADGIDAYFKELGK
ncbi:MAG: N-acetylmuramoyl-L-alanine amidase [Catonella sp.]